MAARAVPAPVRVLAVSDEVDDAIAADPGPARGADLIVACGDLPFEYLGSLMNALDVPLVFVPGNHDPDLSGYRSSRAGLTLLAGMPVRAPWPDGAVNTDGHVVDAAGLRVAGLGGCLRYRDGPNQYTDRQQARRALALRAAARWRRQRDGRAVDVLLTHAPPRGVGDGDDPPHRGFTALHGLTAALRPAALLHGHTHPVGAYGAQAQSGRVGRTIVCNVTGWHLLEIEPGTGEAKLLHGAREQGRRDAR
jgi:Calcineurin-like phosphoesterase